MPQHRAALAAILLLSAAACGEGHRANGHPAQHPAAAGPYYALELPATRDSAGAVHLRDSLAAAGWPATTIAAGGRWRVRLTTAGTREAADLLATGLAGDPDAPPIHIVRDSGASAMPRLLDGRPLSAHPTGMISRLRWAYSPGGGSLLIVDDGAAIENDPAPAAFAVADEASGSLWQRDSIWDAAPSPDWRRIGYSRAYAAAGGESDTLTDRGWDDLAKAAGLSARQVRDGAFRASGMATIFAVARPAVLAVATGHDSLLPETGGWRIRWTAGGDSLAVGHAPDHARDDSPAAGWTMIPLAGGAPASRRDSTGLAAGEWTEGPQLDESAPADTARRVYLPQMDGRLTSAGGWIRLGDTIVAPGMALAATGAGCFVAALAPVPGDRGHARRLAAVVYRLRCRPPGEAPKLP